MKKSSLKIYFTAPLLLTLLACSSSDVTSLIPDNRVDYRQSKNENPLEIPPDLTSDSLNDMLDQEAKTGTASLSSYQQAAKSANNKGNVFSAHSKNLHRAGDSRWLEVKANNADTWRLAIKFWQDSNIRLARKDASIGIMETPWMENKAKLPESFFQRIVGTAVKNIYDTGERDKFRTRIEPAGDVTRIYITHYGAEDIAVDETGNVTSNENAADAWQWLPSKRNPEIEEEMLRRMSLYMYQKGQALRETADDANSKRSLRLSTVQGTPALVFDNTNYNTAWIVLGVAADRAGYEIRGQNRQQGDYKIALVDVEKGAWYSLSGDKKVTKAEYRVRLADNGNRQIAILQSVNGGRVAAETAKAILQKISEAIVL